VFADVRQRLLGNAKQLVLHLQRKGLGHPLVPKMTGKLRALSQPSGG
jgi:hypothetical protein